MINVASELTISLTFTTSEKLTVSVSPVFIEVPWGIIIGSTGGMLMGSNAVFGLSGNLAKSRPLIRVLGIISNSFLKSSMKGGNDDISDWVSMVIGVRIFSPSSP